MFHFVCCFDECEGLMGQLERAIAAPFASPVRTRSWFQSAGFLFSLEFVADWGRREWRQILRRAQERTSLLFKDA